MPDARRRSLAVKVLKEAGLPFAEVAFNNPPGETYAVYTEEVTRRGADTFNCISEYSVSIEIYAYDFFDGEAVRRLADVLDRYVINYTKYDTTFINSEFLYCTRFEFDFIAKDSVADRFLSDFDF